MPIKKLKHPNGDTYTIELEDGESTGVTRRESKGKIRGGTFSSKTPQAALKMFQQLIEDEKEFGYIDPSEKPGKAAKGKTETLAKMPKITGAQWKKWWAGLSDEWQTAVNEAADCDAEEDGFDAIAHLTSFEAPEAGLDDLAPLAMLTGLKSVNLYGNGFSDLTPLANLTGLKTLYIDNCAEVDDLKPLEKITGLEELNVGYTSISSLKPLYNLKNLKTLFVPGLKNEFDDWDSELKKLRAALPKCRVATVE